MVLACQQISKSFGEEPVLKQVSFHVEEYEKTAVVGINGAGKTTLLKIIMGELEPDEGTVTIAKGKTIGYLAQHQDMTGPGSIFERVLEAKRDLIGMERRIRAMEEQMQGIPDREMDAFLENYHRLLHEFDARGGYTYVSEVTGVLKGLGFSEAEFDKPCRELSGGQKTRVSLARLLVTHPDIILLDEPTNHLDIESISWLETFLQNYKGAVIVVAHDRYFLDRVVTKVVEISLHRSAVYEGNYTAYAARAAKVREGRMRAYYNQQREIRRQEEVIEKLKSFNREKSVRRAESREKQLAKVDVLEKPMEEDSQMRISLTPSVVSGKDVLAVRELSKAFGEKVLFDGISFEIQRGERVALIGPNGTGKTTILKILNQVIDADAGSFQLGTNVKIGYYDQEQQALHMEKTLFDEISDDFPEMNRTRIRNVLAAFLFTEDDVFKRIGDLSGGERGRLSLAKLMLSEANFLILDEPTNHLDIASKEILEDALNHYEGTVLFVSHDRYFINRAATRILSLTGRRIVNYIGNYDYYLEKREAAEAAAGVADIAGNANAAARASENSGNAGTLTNVGIAGGTTRRTDYAGVAWAATDSRSAESADGESLNDAVPVTNGKTDWKAMKAEQARLRKRQNQIQRLEDEIAELEARTAEIDEEFAKPEVATNSARLRELHTERTGLAGKLEELYTEWEELCSE
ncbi:MAG: ABC-F type ribosomal protection protein [Clostridiales bacterium]|nr:ABC-F type ribosomal protection protein [Clostridiales bacterium]